MTIDNFPAAILVFGCGNMGVAMLRGWIAGGIEAHRFHIVKPSTAGLPDGVHHYRSAADVNAKFDVLMLGIKPQMLSALGAEAASLLAPDGILISLLAGTESATLQACFPGAQIIRLMPNLAVEIGKSPLGLWANGMPTSSRTEVDVWLSPLGLPIWLSAEKQMDALTALAGSGPAFVYRFIDALADAGAKLGLDPAQAAMLALAMTEGAVALAVESSETPTQLAARVASPGGMTQAGLDILDQDNDLSDLIETTLRTAAQRGAQLAKLTKGDQT